MIRNYDSAKYSMGLSRTLTATARECRETSGDLSRVAAANLLNAAGEARMRAMCQKARVEGALMAYDKHVGSMSDVDVVAALEHYGQWPRAVYLAWFTTFTDPRSVDVVAHVEAGLAA